MNAHQKLAIEALQSTKGDDLWRARAAFRKYTPKQMEQEYGMSGKTPTQLLAEYEQREAAVDAAIAWVKAQVTS